VAGTQVFHRMVLLIQRSAAQETDLKQLLQAQQDSNSPQYHQWLTPTEFGERFGPSANDIAKIAGWLRAQGFTVETPSNGRQFLLFSGSSTQVETAFQTEMHRYRVNGKTYFANAKPASIPTALAPAVSGVASLNSFTQFTPQYHMAAKPQIEIQNQALTGPALAEGQRAGAGTINRADRGKQHCSPGCDRLQDNRQTSGGNGERDRKRH
jgi:subtilase family serine protease